MIFFNEAKPPSKVQITRSHTIGMVAFIRSVVGNLVSHLGAGVCAWNVRGNVRRWSWGLFSSLMVSYMKITKLWLNWFL